MAEQIQAYLVTLATDVSLEQAADITAALRMVKGVLDVCPLEVTMEDHIARVRVRTEMARALLRVLHEEQ